MPRPQFIEPVPEVFRQVEEITAPTAGRKTANGNKLRALAVRPLQPTGQKKNEMIGFFETGFFTGAGIVLSVALPMIGWGAYVVGRKGFEYAVSFRRR